MEKNKRQKTTTPVRRKHRDMLREPWVMSMATVLGLSLVWLIWTVPALNHDSDAGFYLVQKTQGYSRATGSISATFRREPKAGNLLVAVVSSKDPLTFDAAEGWVSAVNDLDQTPGQAVFYRAAPGDGQRTFTFGRFPEKSIMNLQVFEFRGLNLSHPVVSVLSGQGFGDAFNLGSSGDWDSRTLVLTAVSASSRLSVEAWEPSGAVELTDTPIPFGGALTTAASQLFGSDGGSGAVEGRLSKQANWLAHAVAFRFSPELLSAADTAELADPSLSIVSLTPEPKIRLPLIYTLTVKNDGPATATRLDVDHRLAPALQLRTASVSRGSYAQRSGIWSIDELAPGEFATLTVEAVINEEAVHTSFLNIATVAFLDQVDQDADDNQAALMTTPRRPKREQLDALVACKEITGESLLIDAGRATTFSRDVTLALSGKNATYVLIGETDDIMQAAIYPMRGSMPYTIQGEVSTPTLYAWFGNECDQAFAVADSVVLVDPASQEAEEDAPEDGEALVAQGVGIGEDPADAACEFTSRFTLFLFVGSSGGEVVMLQDFLKCIGYLADNVETTGSFGTETEAAVKAFQADHGIAQVGATGPVTREAMNAYLD